MDFIASVADAFCNAPPMTWMVIVIIAALFVLLKRLEVIRCSWWVALVPTYVVAACGLFWVFIVVLMIYSLRNLH